LCSVRVTIALEESLAPGSCARSYMLFNLEKERALQ
jgi:hypothetical protein